MPCVLRRHRLYPQTIGPGVLRRPVEDLKKLSLVPYEVPTGDRLPPNDVQFFRGDVSPSSSAIAVPRGCVSCTSTGQLVGLLWIICLQRRLRCRWRPQNRPARWIHLCLSDGSPIQKRRNVLKGTDLALEPARVGPFTRITWTFAVPMASSGRRVWKDSRRPDWRDGVGYVSKNSPNNDCNSINCDLLADDSHT